jgi:hypothetical protein
MAAHSQKRTAVVVKKPEPVLKEETKKAVIPSKAASKVVKP